MCLLLARDRTAMEEIQLQINDALRQLHLCGQRHTAETSQRIILSVAAEERPQRQIVNTNDAAALRWVLVASCGGGIEVTSPAPDAAVRFRESASIPGVDHDLLELG